MIFYPHVFVTEMVEAALADRKFTTRRTPSYKNSLVDGKRISARHWEELKFDFRKAWIETNHTGATADPYLVVHSNAYDNYHRIYPIYSPGLYDQPFCIWVRESFVNGLIFNSDQLRVNPFLIFKAGHPHPQKITWKSPIYMPASICRLFLQVNYVKIERVQDICDSDCIDEGILPLLQSRMQFAKNGPLFRNYSKKVELFNDGLKPRESFKTLWLKLHGAGSWKRNDWVFAPVFKRIEKPIGFPENRNKRLKKQVINI